MGLFAEFDHSGPGLDPWALPAFLMAALEAWLLDTLSPTGCFHVPYTGNTCAWVSFVSRAPASTVLRPVSDWALLQGETAERTGQLRRLC